MAQQVIDTGATLYDLNKQMVIKETLMSPKNIAAAQIKIENWFNTDIDCYAMLLCNDRRDFTIFHLYENQNPNPCAIAAEEVIGCLTDRGDIISIDPTEDRAWEIWLKINDEAYCYYLFCYDKAVIEC